MAEASSTILSRELLLFCLADAGDRRAHARVSVGKKTRADRKCKSLAGGRTAIRDKPNLYRGGI